MIFNNLFYLSDSNTLSFKSKDKEQFVSTKDINKPFNDIALLQSSKFSNPTTPHIISISDNWTAQNIVKENITAKRSKKRGETASKGN